MAKLSTTAGILNGWKEIAVYLGRGVRTVQRYELSLSLPVRRVSGGVIAYRDELDRWLRASSDKASHHEFDMVRALNALEMHRRAIKNLHQSLDSMMGKIAEGRQIQWQILGDGPMGCSKQANPWRLTDGAIPKSESSPLAAFRQ